MLGALGSMAAVAAIMAICVPLVARRIHAHAQNAEKIVRQAEGSMTGSLNQAASLAEAATRELASLPAFSPVVGDGTPPWPAGPVDSVIPTLGARWTVGGCLPRWPLLEYRPAPFWRTRFRPHPVDWRPWPRLRAWRQP